MLEKQRALRKISGEGTRDEVGTGSSDIFLDDSNIRRSLNGAHMRNTWNGHRRSHLYTISLFLHLLHYPDSFQELHEQACALTEVYMIELPSSTRALQPVPMSVLKAGRKNEPCFRTFAMTGFLLPRSCVYSAGQESTGGTVRSRGMVI